jgi:hypothetical protein
VIIFRALFALILAVPAFAQIRGVPSVAAPVFSAQSLPVFAAASDGRSLPSLPAAPLLSERAAFELQKDADRLYASLADVHNRTQAGVLPAALAPAKRAVAADLNGVLAQLPAGPSDWKEVSARLKSLRAERDALEKTADPEVRAAYSRKRAELNGEIYALQMRAAFLQLMGHAPLAAPALRRNAALWSLVGAFNSAAAGRAESGWREGLDRAEAVFGDGRTVVVSRRWRNAHSELDDAARDARNGRAAQAADKLAALAEILRRAPTVDAEHLARHRAVASALHAAAAAALAGEDGTALSARALAVKDLIPHPKLAEPTPVSYDGAGKAVRAQFHALESSKKEYLAVLARESALARWAEILAGPRPTNADRDAARADMTEARAWAGRGFVGAKQVAAQNLDAALAALDRGDAPLAARHVAFARQELEKRRAELERIAGGVRARLARLEPPSSGLLKRLGTYARILTGGGIRFGADGKLLPLTAPLRVAAFDNDDNLIRYATKIYLRRAGTREELAISTDEFARERTGIGKSGKYKDYAMSDLNGGALRDFFDVRDAEIFPKDLAAAIAKADWKGPSWDAFVRALSSPRTAAWTAIITSRGHVPENMVRGMAPLKQNGSVAALPRPELIFPVSPDSGTPLSRALPADMPVPQRKVEVILELLDLLESVPLADPAARHSFGYSDDDADMIARIRERLTNEETLARRWPHVRITLFATGAGRERTDVLTAD